MQVPDLINGLFELTGGIVNGLNIMAIRRDKKVRGVHWGPFALFSAWGLWNLYYYPFLNQWISFSGGLLIVTINIIWLYHYWLYRDEH